ncbi:MAG: sporulation protein YqfD [Bacillota bacterium]
MKRLFSYFNGYVVLLVEGPVERFINFSINRGVNLWDLESLTSSKIQFKIPLNDFWGMRHIAKMAGCRVTIVGKRGIPFYWAKTKKRKLLILGAGVFIISLYILSSFIWFVDVYSHEKLVHLEKKEIMDTARRAGLKPGILKNNIPVPDVEREITFALPEIAWVGLHFEGTKAIIEVVERKIPSEEYQDRDPRHLVAGKDGIIQEILVLAGQPIVKVGDTVEEGQILVSGLIIPIEAENQQGLSQIPVRETKFVKARGIIRARVWYTEVCQYDLHEKTFVRTGNKSTAYYLKIPSKNMVLKGPTLGTSFENFQGEYKVVPLPKLPYVKLPMELIKATFYEVSVVERHYLKEEAIIMAKRRIMESLPIPENAKIVDEQIDVLMDNDQSIVVRLIIETIEDIAVPKPIE